MPSRPVIEGPWFSCVLGTIVLIVAATPVAAAPITVPTSLSPGDQYRLAFVTSTKRDATSADISVYNTFVDNLADTVPALSALNQNWKAIAATASVNARTNTSTDPTPAGDTGVPIFLLNDTKLVDYYDDLTKPRAPTGHEHHRALVESRLRAQSLPIPALPTHLAGQFDGEALTGFRR